jgi:hypothetical protein
MRFKMTFLIDSGYLGPLMTALHPFPMEDFELQASDEITAASSSPVKPRSILGKKRKHRAKRIMQHYDGSRPTVKDAIWNCVKNAPQPMTVSSIRQSMAVRGYNQNSVPSQLASLRRDGRVTEEGTFIPKRYIAK